MIDDTLAKLDRRLQDAQNLSDENRAAMLALVTELRQEIETLEDADSADSIAGFTEGGAREALRNQTDADLLELNLQGLQRSAQSFQTSHPKLISVVNSLCQQLSNLGI
jgi:queuine/archaeosine tRNA-ribosyltransferase